MAAASLGLVPALDGPQIVSAATEIAQDPLPTTPAAAIPTVELGKSSVNGTVRAAVVDPATGKTYIGGHFTEIGQRTGAMAVVDPPDTGDGDLRIPSPEVVGRVDAVFADDRPDNPGFFIVGNVSAINGAAVVQRPVHRMRLSAGA